MLEITDLCDATVEAAGTLIARQHATARRTQPGLPVAYSAPEACTVALQRLRDTGYSGVIATDCGRALAVMTGIDRGAYALVAADGFAVDPDLEDPTAVLARLYGALAPRFVTAGALRHFIDHIALPRLSEALTNLGFGRHHVYAIQSTMPRSIRTDVHVRIGGLEDLDSIARLAQVELQHRAIPPIYSAPDHRSLDDIAAEHRGLHDRGATHFVAALDGRDVGLLTIELTSPAPRLCPDGQPYIGPTATAPDARRRGVGRTLVDSALAWADRHGFQWLSVDFEPSNPLSRPFWLGIGFKPVGYGVLRSIHPGHQPTT